MAIFKIFTRNFSLRRMNRYIHSIQRALIALILLTGFQYLNAQGISKKALNHSDFDQWKALSKPSISPDGNWVSYEINPQKGDGWLHIHNLQSNMHDSVPRAADAAFSYTSDILVFKIRQPEDTLKKLKLAKKKKEEMPKDSLGILLLAQDSLLVVPGLKSFHVPKEGNAWIAYLSEQEKQNEKVKDSLPANSGPDSLQVKTEKKEEKKKKKGAFKDVDTWKLTLANPLLNQQFIFDHVTDLSFSKNGLLISFVTLKKDSIDSTAVKIFDTRTLQARTIFERPGLVKKTVTDDAGRQVAFCYTPDTSSVKRYSLHLWSEKTAVPVKVADTASLGIPPGWEVNPEGNIRFSEDGNKLYFGTSPKILPAARDTLPEDEKVRVDVWHWQDNRLQSQQLKELEDDRKRSYPALYRIPEKRLIQLADTLVSEVKTIRKGNADLAIGYSDLPYQMLGSWESANYKDIYLLDLKTGVRKKTLTKKPFTADLSPDGKYLYWYESQDKAWYLLDLNKSLIRNLTGTLAVSFCDEEHDTPSDPSPYGIAGWTKEDAGLLLYDRYDIWLLDPKGQKAPVNLTSGRESRTSYRYVRLDPESLSIDPLQSIMLKTKEDDSGKQGFVSLMLNAPGQFNFLSEANAEYSEPQKARLSDQLIWQRSSYTLYPDLWTSRTDFSEVEQLSQTNPQQSQFLWGTMEQIQWSSFEGKPLKGLLYKPEAFDSTARYPMIVYFYEKYSDRPFTHYVPNPSRSTVNFPFYNSNGYIVFVPDITYRTGHPGDDAYISVMSGVMEVLKRPYVDKDHIGIQGQSWGGYQVAYLVTRTGLFKAAMAGAPVSNMTSAYGGIRGESGLVRQFQYEQSQSRIGATLWDARELYIENSPVFFADNIRTPLLIMSNDNDGAVPWQQGIEMFTALRRLGRPAWMLNYNGDEHNLTRRPNRMDLSIRMKQFFDHYLKEEPMPRWMKEGIPAVNKGKTLGYEIQD